MLDNSEDYVAPFLDFLRLIKLLPDMHCKQLPAFSCFISPQQRSSKSLAEPFEALPSLGNKEVHAQSCKHLYT